MKSELSPKKGFTFISTNMQLYPYKIPLGGAGTSPGSVPNESGVPGQGAPGQTESSSDEDRYSRKVFVGGLPPDIDEDEITASFRQFGPLCVDWPHKNESKSYFPPKVRLFYPCGNLSSYLIKR